MKMLNIVALLLVGVIASDVHAGKEKKGLAEKEIYSFAHYEDQLRDNEMTIEEYLDALEVDRANKPEWQAYSKMLRAIRTAQDGRYANVVASLNQPLMEYKSARISRAWFIREVQDIIRRNSR